MAAIAGLGGKTGQPLASVHCTFNWTLDARQLDQTGVTAEDVVRQVANERGAPSGDCEVDAPAIGPWSLGADQVGSVVCYQDGVNAVIEWTIDDEDLLLRASVPYADEKGMLGMWFDFRDKIGSNVGEAPFPTTAEAALIGQLPAPLREDCQRGSYGLIANKSKVRPIASITCLQAPGSGAALLDLLQISDFEDVTASEVIQAIGASPGGCPPSAQDDGRWSIGDRDMGAIVCYVSTLDQIIAWSYDDDRLIARAARRGTELSKLYDWWQANASSISP